MSKSLEVLCHIGHVGSLATLHFEGSVEGDDLLRYICIVPLHRLYLPKVVVVCLCYQFFLLLDLAKQLHIGLFELGLAGEFSRYLR